MSDGSWRTRDLSTIDRASPAAGSASAGDVPCRAGNPGNCEPELDGRAPEGVPARSRPSFSGPKSL